MKNVLSNESKKKKVLRGTFMLKLEYVSMQLLWSSVTTLSLEKSRTRSPNDYGDKTQTLGWFRPLCFILLTEHFQFTELNVGKLRVRERIHDWGIAFVVECHISAMNWARDVHDTSGRCHVTVMKTQVTFPPLFCIGDEYLKSRHSVSTLR